MNFNWTIKNKLLVMGLVAISGMLLLTALSYGTNTKVDVTMEITEVSIENVVMLSDLQIEAQALVLAGMDAIVERAGGRLEDATREEMGHAVGELRAGHEIVKFVAEEHGVPELAERIAELTDRLEKLIGVELVDAVESRASDERFEELDEIIDENGVALVELLAELRETETEELTEVSGELDEMIEAATTTSATIGMVGSAGLAVFLVVLALGISTPMGRLVRVMGDLSNGRLDTEVVDRDRGDEVGEMAQAVQIFKDNAIDKARLEKEQAASAERAEEEKRQTMNEMADRFERSVKEVVDGVGSAATEMQATAQQMSATAEETSRQSANVATASDQATANVQTVAATAEELSASIAEIGRQVMQSARISQSAVDEAEATNETVKGLADAASKDRRGR